MPIDSLRQNVLSVWIGRIVLLVMGVKYSDRIHISTAPTLRTFEQCKTLHWSGALSNLDSLSLYITGARIYWQQKLNHMDPTYYWNENGILTEPADSWGFASDQGDGSDPEK